MSKIKNIIAKLLDIKKDPLWNSPSKIPDTIKPIIIRHSHGIIIGYYSEGEYFSTESGKYEVLKCISWTEYPSNNTPLNE